MGAGVLLPKHTALVLNTQEVGSRNTAQETQHHQQSMLCQKKSHLPSEVSSLYHHLTQDDSSQLSDDWKESRDISQPRAQDNKPPKQWSKFKQMENWPSKHSPHFFPNFIILLQLSEHQHGITLHAHSAICIKVQNLPINTNVQRTLPICHNNLQNLTENHANYLVCSSVSWWLPTLPISS